MKNLMRIVLLLVFSVFLVSCGGITITLDTPGNVIITDGVLTWDAVTDAESYIIGVDTNSYTVTEPTFDLKTLSLVPGDHLVHIVAMAGSEVSMASASVTYTVAAASGLAIPQNVAIANGVVTWSAVTGATGYDVHVGTETYTVTVATYDLNTLTLASGSYNVYVVAKAGTEVSTNSTTQVYVIAGTLAVPQNVAIANGVVTWSAVTSATGYDVHVGTEIYTVTDTTYDLNTLELLPGDHTVFVTAKSATDSSAASLSVTFQVASANVNTIYAAALLAMNLSYVPDMIEDDFEDEDEYREYMDMSQLAYTYSETAAALGMTELESVTMFAHVATTPARMASMADLSGLMTEIDSYDMYGLDSTELANMLYELATTGLTIHLSDLAYKIAEVQAGIVVEQAALVVAQAQFDFSAMRTELAAYATDGELALIDSFLTGQYEGTTFVSYTLYNIANELYYDQPYYNNYDDEYIDMFYSVLDKARVAGDYQLLEQFLTGLPFEEVSVLNGYYMYIYGETDRIEEYTDEIATMTELSAFMLTDKDMIVESLVGVFDYLALVYDTVPATLVSLVDNLALDGELTIPEYITLKDEVTAILLTTLPSDDDFASVYVTLFTVGDAFDIVDFTDYFAYAGFLGDVNHAVIEMGLTFIGDINQTTVDEVMLLVDEMIIPGDYVDDGDYSYYESDSIDFPVAVELAVYLGDYLETFKTDNPALFTNLNTLETDAQVEELVMLFGESVKAVLALELDLEEYDIAEMVIDEVLANYDTLIAAADVFEAVGINVVDEFLTTSGQMLLDLYDLIENGSGDLSNPLFVADVQVVLAQMTDYANAMTSELDATSIETLLSVVGIPIKLQLLMESDLDPADIDALIDLSLVPASAMLDIAFTFVGYLDDQTVVDVISLVDEMIIPGDFVEGTMYYDGYYEPDTVDFPVAVELAVYLGSFLQDFKTDNALKFDALDGLFTDGDIEALLTLVANLALSELELEMDPDEYDMVEMVINELLANYDTIIAASDVFNAIGINIVDEFLTTNGLMLLDLYDLIENGSGDLSDSQFVTDLQAILVQVTAYVDTMTSELDATSIETLLSVVGIPIKLQLLMESDLDPLDIDALIDLSLVPASAVLDIVFTLVGYLDDQTMIDMVLLIDEMQIPGEFVDDGYGGGYYESDTIDFPVAVELAVYLGNFLQDFKTDNALKFDALNILFTNGDIEDLLTLFANLALSELELEMDPAEYAVLAIVVADVLADYDNIIATGEFIETIGSNLVDEFLTTSGQMFLDLYDLMNDPAAADVDVALFALDLMDIFGQAVNYNTAIMGELDATSVESLLRLVKFPLKVQMMTEDGMTEAEFEAFFTALVTPVSTVIVNVATLELALVAALDGMDLTIVGSEFWPIVTEDERAMLLAVITLDTVLTPANEALVFTTLNIIKTDILKNADVLVMMENTAADVDLMIGDIVILLTDVFAEVHVVADFTPMTPLTTAQITQLHDLFAMLEPTPDVPA